jgi:hypothetical protein
MNPGGMPAGKPPGGGGCESGGGGCPGAPAAKLVCGRWRSLVDALVCAAISRSAAVPCLHHHRTAPPREHPA